MIVECLKLISEGKITRTPQGDDFTYAKKLDKKMEEHGFIKITNQE